MQRRVVGAQGALQLVEPMAQDLRRSCAGRPGSGGRSNGSKNAPSAKASGAGRPRGRRRRGRPGPGAGPCPAARAGARTARRCRSRRRSARPGRSPARRSTRRSRWCRRPCGWAPCRGSGPGRARAGRRPRPRSPPSVPISGLSAAVIDDVVAVRAAGPGLQVGRGIAVGDPQVAQVGHDGRGVAEGEAGVELEAVGRFGQPAAGGRLPAACASSVSASAVRVHGGLSRAGQWSVARSRGQIGEGLPGPSTAAAAGRWPLASMTARTCSGVTVWPAVLAARGRPGRRASGPGAGTRCPLRSPAAPRLGSAVSRSRSQMCPSRGLRQGERDRLPVAVEQDQQRLADDRLAALVLVVDQVAGQPDSQALDEAGVPVLVRHLLARRVEERDVLDVRAADRPAQEELPALEDRLAPPDEDQLAGEFQELLLPVVQVPVEPGQLVVLAVGVVVALLAVAQLVAAEHHRHATESISVAMRLRFCRSRSSMMRGRRSGPRRRSSSYCCRWRRRGSPRRWPRCACRCS